MILLALIATVYFMALVRQQNDAAIQNTTQKSGNSHLVLIGSKKTELFRATLSYGDLKYRNICFLFNI